MVRWGKVPRFLGAGRWPLLSFPLSVSFQSAERMGAEVGARTPYLSRREPIIALGGTMLGSLQ